jgi:ParB/RepB/Spo0J family partition protein
MAKSVQKISLSASRDIPFDKLVLSQSNVRHVKAGVSIDELAADIARRTLLQSLTVRPVLDADGAETGMYEIPAGGRRFRALELLVKQKRLAKNTPIPCIVRTEGIAEEDSLAENVQRAPLHPLDQFRAFLALREKGQSEEEIAAVFFVAVSVVKQRLRLASVSPALLDVYAEDGMTLDQLMAFSVSPDHERQEQVWEAIQRSYNKEPYEIRRLLTEGAVRAADKRALYAGEDYVQAGGAVIRDLFQPDDGGWLQDVGLLDRLVAEKLERDAKVISAEGWKWIEVASEFPYGQTYGMRVISSQRVPLSEEEITRVEALRAQAEEVEPYNRRPKAIGHADKIASAISLDLATAGWTPTVDNYLGRVPKARILEAVREAKGQKAANRIGHLKKGDMATEAEGLLTGAGWLPDPLRTPGTYQPATVSDETIDESAATVEETAASADKSAIGDDAPEDDTHHSAGVADAIAAE